MTDKKSVFVSWTRGNPRTRDLSTIFGTETLFVQRQGSTVKRYVLQSLDTWDYFKKNRPETVLIMLPPFPLLLVSWLYAKCSGAKLLADMHTGAFSDPKWSWSRKFSLRLLRNHGVLVTNEYLRMDCAKYGVRAEILHDPIHNLGTPTPMEMRHKILCPVSYANDEPIEELMAAAAQTPECQWYFTGKAPHETVNAAPKNVTFTGYIHDDEYATLLSHAGVVVALTSRAHTMQRAGYEALSYGKPQITSDFPELKEFLEDAALYTKLTAKDIASAVLEAVRRHESLSSNVERVRDQRMREQSSQMDMLLDLISG